MGPLILASTSPQRRAILAGLGVDFEVVAPDYDEVPIPGTPEQVVVARALGKARSVAERDARRPVVGADTEVVIEDAVLGQPPDEEAARAMIAMLAGREHRVVSAVAVIGAGEAAACDAARVRLRALAPSEVDAYVATGEWRGRAGGYAIQEGGGGLVADLIGDEDTVIGLPVALLRRLLADQGGSSSEAGGNALPA